jgi:FtsZ-interacting cell division protein YlmF
MRENVLAGLSEWGPSVVAVLAVSLSGLIALRLAGSASRSTHSSLPVRAQSGNVLQEALSIAESISGYDATVLSNPNIHLGEIVRLAPTKYQEAVIEIPRYFKNGSVVSVDLGGMDISQAARLVDFCSGMLAGSSGWLFRATDRVIVLTPTRV